VAHFVIVRVSVRSHLGIAGIVEIAALARNDTRAVFARRSRSNRHDTWAVIARRSRSNLNNGGGTTIRVGVRARTGEGSVGALYPAHAPAGSNRRPANFKKIV